MMPAERLPGWRFAEAQADKNPETQIIPYSANASGHCHGIWRLGEWLPMFPTTSAVGDLSRIRLMAHAIQPLRARTARRTESSAGAPRTVFRATGASPAAA